jgi:hypothetical protein
MCLHPNLVTYKNIRFQSDCFNRKNSQKVNDNKTDCWVKCNVMSIMSEIYSLRKIEVGASGHLTGEIYGGSILIHL